MVRGAGTPRGNSTWDTRQVIEPGFRFKFALYISAICSITCICADFADFIRRRTGGCLDGWLVMDHCLRLLQPKLL